MPSLMDFKLNFNGGDLTSDAGLLLLREFDEKIGFSSLVKGHFKTKDTASFHIHTDGDNLLQKMYQNLSGYFSDDNSDELIKEVLFTTLLNKDALASQSTMFRFFNRMDEDTLIQLD